MSIFKYSADDVPKWMPDWVREHPEIEEVSKISTLPKDIPIEDFRIDLDKDKAKNLDLGSDSIHHLSAVEKALKFKLIEMAESVKSTTIYLKEEALDNITFVKFRDPNNIEKLTKAKSEHDKYVFLYKIISAYLYIITENKVIKTFKLTTPISYSFKTKITTKTGEEKEVTKTINIPADTSVIKAAKIIEKIYQTYADGDLKSIKLDPTGTKEFNMYSKRGTGPLEFNLVFSTKAEDILAMSSRGMFTSCQNLFGDRDYNEKAIYAAISRYTGIIYITNKQDFDNRGEQIVARAIVFYVVRNNVPYLGLSKVYYSSGNQGLISQEFLDVLKEHSPIPVVDLMEDSYNEYEFPNEGKDMAPYFDPGNIHMQPREELHSKNEKEYSQFLDDIYKESPEHIISKIESRIRQSVLKSIANKNSKFYKEFKYAFSVLQLPKVQEYLLKNYIDKNEDLTFNKPIAELKKNFLQSLNSIDPLEHYINKYGINTVITTNSGISETHLSLKIGECFKIILEDRFGFYTFNWKVIDYITEQNKEYFYPLYEEVKRINELIFNLIKKALYGLYLKKDIK